jgi:hypothetical protein
VGEQADRGEAVRLAGTVLEVSSPAFASTSVTIDGKRFDHRQPGWLVVDVGGQRVRIDADDATAVGQPSFEATGAWRELRDRTKLSPDIAPPFKPASLVHVEPAIGERIEVYGEVAERALAGEQGYRDAPEVRLRRVRASVVARGDGADAALVRAVAARHPPKQRAAAKRADPRRSDPGNPLNRPPLGEYVLSAGLAAAALVIAAASHSAAGVVVALGALAGAVSLRPERTERTFRARADSDDRFDAGVIGFLATLIYSGALLGVATVMGAGPLRFAALGFIALLIGVEVRVLLDLGTLRRLVRGTPWQGAPADDVILEGEVRDPTPVTVGSTEAAALGRTTELSAGIGSNPDTVNWTRFHADGTFLIDTEVGVVEVDPDELVWASTVVQRPDERHGTYKVSEVVPVGGKVVATGSIVAGEPGAPPRLRANGTTPAVLLATSNLGEPRGLARAIVRHHQLNAVVFVTLLAVAGILVL